MIISGTGHRPDKLGGYDALTLIRLTSLAVAVLNKKSPSKVISGMALGWDTALALGSIQLGIPLVAAIPFKGQELSWPKASQNQFQEIISKACLIEIVSGGGYHPNKMQTRNEWMVNNSELVVALWDGSSGGTSNCVRYANKVNKPILNVWDSWKKFK